MKKEIIHSLVVLVTIVSGIIAGLSLGMTKLISYAFKEQATMSMNGIPMDTMIIGQPMICFVTHESNIGWVFLGVMCLGIVVLVAWRIAVLVKNKCKKYN